MFKSGNRSDVNNYRPITILPVFSKLLEKAVYCQLNKFFTEQNLLTTKQFGFRPKLSTGAALAQFTDTVLDNMDKGCLTGAAFLDITKAFDTVSHDILICKLVGVGVSHTSVNWFKSYLSNRMQVTVVNESQSTLEPLNVGVPQGSILGPLLFLVYVNDITKACVKCNFTLYADDTVLFYSAKSALELQSSLNLDLFYLSNWLTRNRLTLNPSKCKFITFGSPAKLAKLNEVELCINDYTLDRVTSFKYLGVVLNQSFTWADHIEALSNKIAQRIGLIKRIKHLLPVYARITLANCLVVPLFDYADSVWGDKDNLFLMNQLQIMHNKLAKVILDAAQILRYRSITDFELASLGRP